MQTLYYIFWAFFIAVDIFLIWSYVKVIKSGKTFSRYAIPVFVNAFLILTALFLISYMYAVMYYQFITSFEFAMFCVGCIAVMAIINVPAYIFWYKRKREYKLKEYLITIAYSVLIAMQFIVGNNILRPLLK